MAARPNDSLAGELVVVTGASRGIGRAVSVALARESLHLLLVARAPAALGSVAQVLRDQGATVATLALDVADPRAPDQLIAHVERDGRVPFALVNNAGIAHAHRFERLARDDLDHQVEVNLLGPMRLTHALLPKMLERGRGRFIHLGSGAADFPARRLLVYSATKSALRAFSFGLDLEVRRRGVRSTVVEPIFVRTDLGRRPGDVEAPLERLHRDHPRFVLEPETVASAVVGALHRPRRRVSVPLVWGAGRLLGLAAGPIVRRALELAPPRPASDGDGGTPVG
ncbi:MAG: SDR family NAD(P)-dependent oxidoreductase [Thermoplasmata archaeon]